MVNQDELIHSLTESVYKYLAPPWRWSLIPIRGGLDGDSDGNGKKPLYDWAEAQKHHADPTRLAETINAKRNRTKVVGLGLVTGSISGGVAVRDFDSGAAYEEWASEYAELADTLPTVTTGRGKHVYFRYADEIAYKWPDGSGELRCSPGQYVLMPGSWHAGKQRHYEWQKCPSSPADLPFLDPVAAGFLPTDWHEKPTAISQLGGKNAARKHQWLSNTDSSTPLMANVSPPVFIRGNGEAVENAIIATLPTREGERNNRLFDLCGRLKAIDPMSTAEVWEPVVRDWWQLAWHVIQTKDWATTWTDFIHGWQNRRTPIVSGSASIDTLLEMAKRFAGTREDKLRQFCQLLSEIAKGGAFPLAASVAARAIGVHRSNGHEYIRRAIRAGWLIEVKKGESHPTARNASTYRLSCQSPA